MITRFDFLLLLFKVYLNTIPGSDDGAIDGGCVGTLLAVNDGGYVCV